MKKMFSAVCAFVMAFVLSVTAFAGAPDIFEESGEIINTGGEGLGIMIAAGVAVVLAIAGIVFFIISGKKK